MQTTCEHHGAQRILEAVEKRSPSPASRIFQCILIDKSFLLAIASEKLVYPPFPQYISTTLTNTSWQTPCEKAKYYPSRVQHRWGMEELRYPRRDLWINLVTEKQAFRKIYFFWEPAQLLKHLQRRMRHRCLTCLATFEKSERFLSES